MATKGGILAYDAFRMGPITEYYAAEKVPVGTLAALYTSAGVKIYMFVKFDNGAAVAAAANNLAYWNDNDGYEVTSDFSASANTQVAGVFLAAVTDAYYCWIQVGGVATLAGHDSAIADGECLVAHGGDGDVDVMSGDGEQYLVIAVALAAAGTGTGFPVVARLRGLL